MFGKKDHAKWKRESNKGREEEFNIIVIFSSSTDVMEQKERQRGKGLDLRTISCCKVDVVFAIESNGKDRNYFCTNLTVPFLYCSYSVCLDQMGKF